MPGLLFVSSEATPLIKTGGLADVCGSLPPALQALGWDIRLLLPAYPAAVEKLLAVKTIARLPLSHTGETVKILEGRIPDSRLMVWLVEHAPSFGRKGNPYVDDKGDDWADNAERFALFARVATSIARNQASLDWQADVVHCNDWQTGLVPALLSLEAQRPATVFTIHNLAYQGLFPAASFHALGLPPSLWSYQGLEFHGQLSFIKGGLAYADCLTTVSPGYAREIQTPEFGCGLEGLLQHRSDVLHGILNGIDDKEWNPNKDPRIVQPYGISTLGKKAVNKQALQKSFKLPQHSDALLLGSVSRLVTQKGTDLLLEIIPQLAKLPLQIAMLGSGDKKLETALQRAAGKYPRLLGLQIGYDETLAHRIEAGADAFLMPSRFEPCGLNQLYSLRYGTPPIVHAVGGLKDTVTDTNPATLENGSANGFCFHQPGAQALLDTIKRALQLYRHQAQWKKVMKTGMRQSFSWEQSAHRYDALYRSLL